MTVLGQIQVFLSVKGSSPPATCIYKHVYSSN